MPRVLRRKLRDARLRRGIEAVEVASDPKRSIRPDVQRIDEGRVPTFLPRGAIVAIDVSFMSHPVAEKPNANAVASGVPVFKFARLGPARLYRRLVRFLQERDRHGMKER